MSYDLEQPWKDETLYCEVCSSRLVEIECPQCCGVGYTSHDILGDEVIDDWVEEPAYRQTCDLCGGEGSIESCPNREAHEQIMVESVKAFERRHRR
jgi:DnaJ-class molecular chaperone